jgi:uncharacterized protein YneF (UPF0154 family)
VGKQIFFLVSQSEIRNGKSANFRGVPVSKSQMRKYVMINPKIANPQISLVSQSANRKSSNSPRRNVSNSHLHWFALGIFLTYVGIFKPRCHVQ